MVFSFNVARSLNNVNNTKYSGTYLKDKLDWKRGLGDLFWAGGGGGWRLQ